MNQKEKDSNLFAEFPPVPTEQWEEQIKKDLKGADYKKKLVWRTREGFEIKPYYRREDTASLDHLDTYPGDFPYTRGNAVKKNEWRIRQDIPVEDIKSANKKALDILMKGIDSVGFVFREDDRPTTDKRLAAIGGLGRFLYRVRGHSLGTPGTSQYRAFDQRAARLVCTRRAALRTGRKARDQCPCGRHRRGLHGRSQSCPDQPRRRHRGISQRRPNCPTDPGTLRIRRAHRSRHVT
jgi:hypothetical protein